MTAPVIDLASHRLNREQAAARQTCQHCRPDHRCYPHAVAWAVDLLHGLRDEADVELLIRSESVASAVRSALPDLERIVAETLPADERPAR